MRTITVTEKHKAVNEGRMSKSEFVRQMRQSYPMYISPQNGYDATVQILKNKQMLFEEKEYEVDDTFKYSDDSLRRAVDIELEAMGLMSHETILIIVAPISVFTAGVVILPIIVKPRKESVSPKRYVRGL